MPGVIAGLGFYSGGGPVAGDSFGGLSVLVAADPVVVSVAESPVAVNVTDDTIIVTVPGD